MAWTCRLVDYTDGPFPNEIGTMWYCPENQMKRRSDGRLVTNGYVLSDEYLRDWQDKRPPLFVMLPRRVGLCLDSAYTDPAGTTHGWTVTGEAPLITVTPSIHIGGLYHGWLQNGVLSDG